MFWTAYELQRFRRREGPDLDLSGMFCDDTVLLWLRNPAVHLALPAGRSFTRRLSLKASLSLPALPTVPMTFSGWRPPPAKNSARPPPLPRAAASICPTHIHYPKCRGETGAA